jgi:DNA polymerase I-like protein with 3'-5' exonuclease and polymerase domains
MNQTVEKAQEFRATYDERIPFAKELMDTASKRAGQKGFVRTIGGRKCRFKLWEPAKRYKRGEERPKPLFLETAKDMWPNMRLVRSHTHKGINRIIQGSAADWIKKAMADCFDAGFTPNLQVHDELDFADIQSKNQVNGIKEIMETSYKLEVPMVCEVQLGPSWSGE